MTLNLVRSHPGICVGLLALLFASCGVDLIDNPSFDFWCGDRLCQWQTDEGSIKRVPSWHKGDYAVSLSETPTQISQLSTNDPVPCIRFDMISDVVAEARVKLMVDFGDDGIVDFDEEVPATSWKTMSFLIAAPSAYDSVRFILRKNGKGRAVLAQVRARGEYECGDEPRRLADGSECSSDAVCDSGACLAGRCSQCARTGDCKEGSVCKADAQCQSGACAGHVCQQCAADGTCEPHSACNAHEQCASEACVPNFSPSSLRAPQGCAACQSNEECGPGGDCINGICAPCTIPLAGRVCGACALDSDCGQSEFCTFGACSSCRSDADCENGQLCLWDDDVDATARHCVAPRERSLPRGALCERDEECAQGLACAAAEGEPKRCGTGCETDWRVAFSAGICGESAVCARPGLTHSREAYALVSLPAWSTLFGRIATCYPRIGYDEQTPCEVHDQCESLACCAGRCTDLVVVDPQSGKCVDEPVEDME